MIIFNFTHKIRVKPQGCVEKIMSINTLIHVCDPQMSQSSFILDFSDYNGDRNSGPQTFADRFPISWKKLKQTVVKLPGLDNLQKQLVAAGKPKKFITHHKTTKDDVKKFLRNYVNWHVQYLMATSKIYASNPAMKEDMKRRLDEDPIGLKDRPHSDVLCYTTHTGVQVADTSTPAGQSAADVVTRSASAAASATADVTATAPTVVNHTQHVPTDFYNKLKHYQKQLYITLRVNITDQMDPTAKD